MTAEPILPDVAPAPEVAPHERQRVDDAGAFTAALDAIARTLGDATGAEDAFASGAGTLQEAVYERAQADVALAVATSSAARIVSSVQSLLNMQV